MPESETPTTLTIVTAVDEGRTQFLQQLAESLCEQKSSSRCSVTWSVRFDGDRSVDAANTWRNRLGDMVVNSALSRVVVGANGVRRGTATTRTMALYAAPAATWVLSIDADDLLAPGALEVLCATGDKVDTTVGFVSGGSVRFGTSPTGEEWSQARPDQFGPGLLPRGEILRVALSGNLAPVTPNTIMYRSALVEALGGWPAVVSAEDVGLLYTVAELVDGYRIDQTVLLRRRWDGQVTAGSDAWHVREHDLFIDVAIRRAQAARAVFGDSRGND